MMQFTCYRLAGSLVVGQSCLALPALPATAAEKPNILFTLTDDYGIPGVGCYGGVHKTPNLDVLAAGGMRFERCFSAPLCAPSRALCMVGR